MARRMFSDRVTSSARFFMLPVSAQALFFHLGMYADDEGVTEGFIPLKLTGVSKDDLKLLEEKRFIKILNEELVIYIENWQEHNAIRPDRIKESVYHDLLKEYLDACGQPAAECPQPVNQVSANCPQTDRQPAAKCPPKLSKVKLSKDKLGEDNIAAARESTNSEYIGTPVDNSVDNLQQPPLATKLASDEPFAKTMALYQDNIHPVANQVEADDLISMFDDYGEEWLTQAIKEAARNNARSIKYIAAVLRSWERRGVPDPWNHRPPKKPDNPFRGRTPSDRAADVCRGALELLEASS